MVRPSSARTTTACAGNRPDLLPARTAFLTGYFSSCGCRRESLERRRKVSKKITRRLATVLSAGAAAGLLLTGTASAATAGHSHADASGADSATSASIDYPIWIT